MVLKKIRPHHPPDDADRTEAVFRTQLCLSVLTMLLCFVVFCATTFAWFTSQKCSEVEAVVAAEYDVDVTVDGAQVTGNSHTCTLVEGDRHTVTIAATGTAQTGYCVIQIGNQTYTTAPILPGHPLELTIVAAQRTEITFSASWGTSDTAPCGNVLEISRTEYVEYTVAENVTLEQIAAHYGVSAVDIRRYNGITELSVGMTIQIPNPVMNDPLSVAAEEPVVIAEDLPPVEQETAETPVENPESIIPDDPLLS